MKRWVTAALVGVTIPLAVGAAYARPFTASPLLVTTSWLKDHLRDRNVVLLHVGDPQKFSAGHIPGARTVRLSDVSVSDTSGPAHTMLQMPTADVLKARLEALGISNGSQVVIYAAQQWFTPATRVLLTLDYAGLGDHAVILDGGLDAWQKAGLPVETGESMPTTPGGLSPLKIQPFIVDAAYVDAHIGKPGFAIVDARNRGFYDGVMIGGGGGGGMPQHLKGHIASARSIPFNEVWTDSSYAQSTATLRALFTKAGVTTSDTVIAYCHIGQQATSVIFAARLIGQPFRFYDGSFEDWSRQPNARVETTPRP